MKKKLTLSQDDKKILGVCGGIAEYLEVDSSFVRIIWVLISLVFGFGIITYLICAMVIPKKEG